MAKKLPAGIEWDSARSKYRVTVYVNGKRYRLGRFDTLTDAKAAVTIAKADIAEIMERGGHSDVEVAMRYQHAAEDRARRLADNLPVEL